MSSLSKTIKPVRLRTKCSSESEERCAEQELNGLEGCEDTMTDEDGEGVEGEAEVGTAYWRVTRIKSTAREREDEATHMPFRDWCAHCMWAEVALITMCRRSDLSRRRPITAVDYSFIVLSENVP